MKIQLASNLHLEFLSQRHLRSLWKELIILPHPDADILVLAGDIDHETSVIDKFEYWPVPVICVAGNHEFYGHDMNHIRSVLRTCSEGTNIHYLDDRSVVIVGARFVGSMLWTDYLLGPGSQQDAMNHAQRMLNDHRLISVGDVPFTPNEALILHKTTCSWLSSELGRPFDGKTVVVTHHGPSAQSTHPRYKYDLLNASFNSNLSADLIERADLWLHGHVHDSFVYRVGKCRVATNPAGCVKGLWSYKTGDILQTENPRFQRQFLIEI